MKRRLPAILALAIPLASFAQEFRGTVTDPTGAAIPGAKVTVTETHTGVATSVVSGSNGEYSALFPLSGDYEIAAGLLGFKDAIRKGVHIGAGDHPIIDIRLDVGAAAESVEVTADAPLVNNENASLGQTITTKEVEDFPINGGAGRLRYVRRAHHHRLPGAERELLLEPAHQSGRIQPGEIHDGHQ